MLRSLNLFAIGRATHPLWLCPFRPFFALTVLMAPAMMLLWLAFLGHGWPLPVVPGGPVVWHAHELIMGMGLAAVAGFVLTAVPEFTGTPGFGQGPVRQLVGWWLLGRVGFWLSGWWPVSAMAVAGLAHLMLMGQLIWLVAPRLWQESGRRQLGFLWGLITLGVTVAGFYLSACLSLLPLPWLHATVSVLLILIIVSMSRISMAIVNDSIDERLQKMPQPHDSGVSGASDMAVSDSPASYLARPPRRHMAVFCTSLFALAYFIDPNDRLAGWLALASSAAMLNLLNDWHVGRALWRRWPLMLYLVYGLMALGYGVLGLSILAESPLTSAGVHLLTAGALGLAIYAVICIAGYTHSGLDKDGRPWVKLGAALLVVGALLRALSAGWPEPLLMAAAGLSWAAAFVLQLWQMLPVFLSPRQDGGTGCEGVMDRTIDPAVWR
ncbi:MAG: NnrS family protein [Lautropia sp.]|nr:NnrS family protein [Lautropia sp.]